MNFEWIEKIEGQHKIQLCEFYAKEVWTVGRTDEQVSKILLGSDITIGCCDANHNLIGFARVLTDYTLKALIFDLIVRVENRGQKVGDAVMRQILDHKKLSEVTSFELYCPARLNSYYERLGFKQSASNLLLHKRK